MATPAQFVALTGGGAAAAPFSPSDIAGLVSRWDFSNAATLFTDTGRTTPVVADGNAIAGVTDLGSGARHLSQSNAARRPLYKTAAGIWTRSFARFDGSDDSMVTGSQTLNQPNTVFVVVARASIVTPGANITMFNGGVSSFGSLMVVSVTNRKWGYYAGTLVEGSVQSDTTQHVLTGIFNGASSSLRLDGSGGTTNPGTTGNAAQAASVGANGDLAAGNGQFNGDFAEILIYDSALSGANLTNVEAYLKAKWGTP